jgi:hypothetical protein
MTKRFALFAAVMLLAGAAHAQVQLPSAGSDAPPAETKPTESAKPAAKKDTKKDTKPNGVASILGKTLKLNGVAGSLTLSKGDSDAKDVKDKPLKIDKLTLAGEVISNPQQKCEITIAADGSLSAANQGSPDGLPRYAAEIPACPLSFDVVNGGIIVPPQTRACVFQAADCQASPSGVWGPDAAALTEESKAIAKDRSRAENSIAESLKILGRQSKGADSELEKEQSDFNAMRDETCRDYQGETAHGFCDARLTDARAALLRKQTAKAKSEKKDEKKKKKKEQDSAEQ